MGGCRIVSIPPWVKLEDQPQRGKNGCVERENMNCIQEGLQIPICPLANDVTSISAIARTLGPHKNSPQILWNLRASLRPSTAYINAGCLAVNRDKT